MSSPKLSDDRSYIVQTDYHGNLFVKASHWLPGYTDAYKATPKDAIQYHIRNLTEKLNELKKQQDEAVELLNKELTAPTI